MRVDNAVILAAGTSSRFAPLSYEKPKALIDVKGEVLIERQIRQLIDAGVPKIFVVTGYKADQLEYLQGKYGVELIYNSEYLIRNNNSSIWAARNILKNSYVCSADNYFNVSPFEEEVDVAYYAAVYAEEYVDEWCMEEDAEGYISSITMGGKNAWYMFGHTFWSEEFSKKFLEILEAEYNLLETADKLWEKIFMEHLDIFRMKIRKYEANVIYEFDTLDELRKFDESYITNTRSELIKEIAGKLGVTEDMIINIRSYKLDNAVATGFEFDCRGNHYRYLYEIGILG